MAGKQVLTLSGSGSVVNRVGVEGYIRALAAAPGGGFFAAVPHEERVDRYRADGKTREPWAIPGDSPLPSWPCSLSMDARGRLLVLDRRGGRIVRLDVTGRVDGVGSRRGWAEGLLLYPAAVTILADGRVAVADQGNGRVQIFHRQDQASDSS
jgi:hypothetical protein